MNNTNQEILNAVEHRPWPLPARPWIMAQSWRDLLFAHWPIPVSALRALMPPQLALDTFDGTGWVGVVPFGMRGVRPRDVPALPGLSAFPELNMRTYVRGKTGAAVKPGVYFFSLEAGNPIAVTLARRFFKLPYVRAHMHLVDDGRAIHYRSYRTHSGAPFAEFIGHYAPTGAIMRTAPGSLEHWLTERYCLYTVDRRGRVYRGDIHHKPWPLQLAEAEFEVNTLAAASGIELPDRPPLLHFARRLDMVAWWLERVDR